MTDYNLLEVSTQPHGRPNLDFMMASVDHAIWFHRDFRLDDWILYEVDCTNISGGRAISKGRFYQDGKLVASVVQEGLMRVRKPLDTVSRIDKVAKA